MREHSPENWVAIMVLFRGTGEMGGWSRKCREDEPGEWRMVNRKRTWAFGARHCRKAEIGAAEE